MRSFKTESAAETIALGEEIGRKLSPGAVVALNGGLGAGKTWLSKGIAKALGFGGDVVSPTFTIINIYAGKVPIYHFDCYRLNSNADLENIGYEEYFYGKGVTLVEWAEKIAGLLPENSVYIDIKTVEGNSREFQIKNLEF